MFEWWIRFRLRLKASVMRRRLDRDLEEELKFHVAAREASFTASGVDEPLAQMAARRAFGNAVKLKEDCRDMWTFVLLENLFQDLHFAVRTLRKAPGFAATAVCVLALGIGLNLTALRMVDQELHPPGVRDPNTLVHLERWFPNGRSTRFPYPMLAFYSANSRAFREVIASRTESVVLGDTVPDKVPEMIQVSFVTSNYFVEQGNQVSSGRPLDRKVDEIPGAEKTALLSEYFWHRMGGNPGLAGDTIRLNGRPVRIVGILRNPHESRVSVWMPLSDEPYVVEGSKLLTDWKSSTVDGAARLNTGVSARAAEDESRSLAARLREIRPGDVPQDERLNVVPFSSFALHADEAALAAVTLALAMLILVVACANIGTLLLARGLARDREIRTRLALGATRGRVVRQFLTESVLLAVIGSLAGLFLRSLAIGMINGFVTFGSSVYLPGWRVVSESALISLLAAATFGVAPALQLTRLSPRFGRSRAIFLSAQVGASCILLMLSGLLVRSSARMTSIDPGFDYRKIVSISPGLAAHGYNNARAKEYMETLSVRMRAQPGVEAASVVWLAPWGNSASTSNDGLVTFNINRVDENFLKTMRMSVTRGRNFEPGERDVAIVNESLGRTEWPGENPIGKRLRNASDVVVGVVKTASTFRAGDNDAPGVYYPLEPSNYPQASLVARVAGEPGKYAAPLIAVTRARDLKLRPEFQELTAIYEQAVQQSRILSMIIGMMGLLASLLASLGVAGMTGYTVVQQTREIGIRLALGSGKKQILEAILRPLGWPVTIGLVIGMFGAGGIATVLRHRLSDVSPLDVWGYAMASIVFAGVIAAALFSPARRAIRIRPADALRHE